MVTTISPHCEGGGRGQDIIIIDAEKVGGPEDKANLKLHVSWDLFRLIFQEGEEDV